MPEALLEALLLERELVHPLADLRAVEHAIGREVDEVGLFRLQGGELLFEGATEIRLGLVLRCQRSLDAAAQLVDHAVIEPFRLVEALHRGFGFVQRDVGGVAGAFLPAAAEEVEVFVPLAHRAGDDHPVAASFALAPAAEERAAEVVGVDAASFVSGRPGLQHGLHAGKQRRGDKRFVSAAEPFTAVGDESQVVRVAQQAPHLLLAQGAGRVLARAPRPQSAFVELFGELDHRVLVGRADLERLLHQRTTFGVDDDGTDLTVVDPLPHVEVADRCARDGPALAGFGGELVLDVGPVRGGPVLVEGREDAVEHLPFGCLVDVLRRRDQGDSPALELGHDEGVVDAVAVHPAELVDDEVGHVLLLSHPCEHLGERDPLAHLAS